MKQSVVLTFLCLMILLGMAPGDKILPAALSETTGVSPDPAVPSAEDGSTQLLLNNADIQDVLRLIAEEYDLNIVMGDQVRGTVTLRLKEASLVNTLDAILVARGFDYEIRDNIIRVGPADVIEAERGQRRAKQELEPLASKVITLRYLDANDVKPMVESLLTSRGSVKVLERRTYKGFKFGGDGGSGAQPSGSGSGTSSGAGSDIAGLVRSRAGEEKPRSNTLLVVDIPSQIERVQEVVGEVDVAPRQVLIDARILEVDTNTLEDIGLDFSSDTSFSTSGDKFNPLTTDVNSGASSSTINDNIFSETFPGAADAGIHTVFQRLNGEDFTATLHALLQDEHTKTLSAPKILTIENQEAAILVGEQFPIFEANVSDQGTTTESLSYFQPIGISMQVIVQVTPQNDISMIIHPTVSSVGDMVIGTSGLTQPRINIREADTRVLIKHGETLVIGGLLHDVMDEKVYRLPFLGQIPVMDKLFTRRQTDVDQRNLLIFITPKIVDMNEPLSEAEKLTLQGTRDPARFGFLGDRRQTIDKLYEGAKQNYENHHPTVAREQFLRVLSLDPRHEGATKYLKEMNALPQEKPYG